MAKAQSEHLWLTQYMASEQNLGSNEKGTKVGVPAEAIEKRKPRTNRFLHDQNLRGMQKESLKRKNEEVLDFNFLFENNLTDSNKYQYYRSFMSKNLGHISRTRMEGNKLIIPGVCYTPEVTLNILSQELLEKQGFTICYEGNRCSIVPMFKDKKVVLFDADWRTEDALNKYIPG
ncbi:hypothetical protein Tco_0302965 [Tanacetum coccineum]